MKQNSRSQLKVPYHGEPIWHRLLLRSRFLDFNGLREWDHRRDAGRLAGGLALGSLLFVLEKGILPFLRIVDFVGKLGLQNLQEGWSFALVTLVHL